MPAHAPTPQEAPTQNNARNSHPHKTLQRGFPLNHENALKSVARAKAALAAVYRVEGVVGADVAQGLLDRAQKRLQRALRHLRPLRTTAHIDNTWWASLEPVGHRTATSPLQTPPDAILALFPRIEPVWLTPAEDRSASARCSTEEDSRKGPKTE